MVVLLTRPPFLNELGTAIPVKVTSARDRGLLYLAGHTSEQAPRCRARQESTSSSTRREPTTKRHVADCWVGQVIAERRLASRPPVSTATRSLACFMSSDVIERKSNARKQFAERKSELSRLRTRLRTGTKSLYILREKMFKTRSSRPPSMSKNANRRGSWERVLRRRVSYPRSIRQQNVNDNFMTCRDVS
jgi:hypothetical protein